ncbi:MAG: PEGA domain-containing protein [Deltaproteobacteria bacterium]|nr:PEGA domain-containing protein [Deltaproteobacteria bacterium]
MNTHKAPLQHLPSYLLTVLTASLVLGEAAAAEGSPSTALPSTPSTPTIACSPLPSDASIVLVVLPVNANPEAAPPAPAIAATIRAAAAPAQDADSAPEAGHEGALRIVSDDVSRHALTVESQESQRIRAVDDARVMLAHAEERFRQLDDEVALGILAKATSRLASAHDQAGAIELLAETHLLAGAIYLARDRVDAARKRLQRALDLAPDIAPARDRYTSRLLAELEGLRAAEAQRPVGRVLVTLRNDDLAAEIFLDGRAVGTTPATLEAVGVGRHLLRITAPGRRSHVASIDVGQDADAQVSVHLPVDEELSAIMALGADWRAHRPIDETLRLIARRANANRTLLAIPMLSAALAPDGRAETALELVLSGGASPVYIDRCDPASVREALRTLMRCERTSPVPRAAPALLDLGNPLAQASAVPSEPSLWAQPWFWAGAAITTVVVSSAVVMARTQKGPPEALRVTLVPRP